MAWTALLFDCDGVLAETERDGHRLAFNYAFKQMGIDGFWDVEDYARWVKISGGKERMGAYLREHPELCPDGQVTDELIAKLYEIKSAEFQRMCRAGDLPVRPGITRIIDQAHAAGIKLCVCSTSGEKSVATLMEAILGAERLSWFRLFCGDIVPVKKPAPDIYLLAASELDVRPEDCLVVEDSRNGLEAALAAGMRCIVTQSYYEQDEDFTGAHLIVDTLGDETQPAHVVGGIGPLPTGGKPIDCADLEALF